MSYEMNEHVFLCGNNLGLIVLFMLTLVHITVANARTVILQLDAQLCCPSIVIITTILFHHK